MIFFCFKALQYYRSTSTEWMFNLCFSVLEFECERFASKSFLNKPRLCVCARARVCVWERERLCTVMKDLEVDPSQLYLMTRNSLWRYIALKFILYHLGLRKTKNQVIECYSAYATSRHKSGWPRIATLLYDVKWLKPKKICCTRDLNGLDRDPRFGFNLYVTNYKPKQLLSFDVYRLLDGLAKKKH